MELNCPANRVPSFIGLHCQVTLGIEVGGMWKCPQFGTVALNLVALFNTI